MGREALHSWIFETLPVVEEDQRVGVVRAVSAVTDHREIESTVPIEVAGQRVVRRVADQRSTSIGGETLSATPEEVAWKLLASAVTEIVRRKQVEVSVAIEIGDALSNRSCGGKALSV